MAPAVSDDDFEPAEVEAFLERPQPDWRSVPAPLWLRAR